MSALLSILNPGFIPWESLSEARAGLITLTGLSAVSSGLVILYFSMTILRKLFAPKPVIEETPPAEDASKGPSAEKPPEPKLARTAPGPEFGVELAQLTAATVALDRVDRNLAELGDSISVQVGGKKHTTRVLAIGYPDRVLVDEEEVTVLRSRTAPMTQQTAKG